MVNETSLMPGFQYLRIRLSLSGHFNHSDKHRWWSLCFGIENVAFYVVSMRIEY